MSYSDGESYSDADYYDEDSGGWCYSSDGSYGGGGGYSSEEVYGGDDSDVGEFFSEQTADHLEDLEGDDDDFSKEEHAGEYETDSEYVYEDDDDDDDEYELESFGFPPLEVMNPNSGFYGYGSEQISKYYYNDYESGKNYSGKYTKDLKTEKFVDGRSGKPVIKEEEKYTSNYKVDDKIGGFKTEYETQVKTTTKVTSTSNYSGGYDGSRYSGGSNGGKYSGGYNGSKYSGGSYRGEYSGGSSRHFGGN